MCCHTGQLMAQSRTVTGQVTDNDHLPMIGVSVAVKGSVNGTITDLDGNYSLGISGPDDVLVFSFIGYTTQEIKAGQQAVISVVLAEDVKVLDEVVVVGYGVQKKSHLTGSVSKVKTDELADIPVSRLDQALQGKIAGVQITNTTTEAGVAPQIRVRGMGSISASGDPLVVVDGFPVADGLGFVDMSDVESIEVLKDAASSAIYGSRGANGVILITTKQGEVKKPKYSFKASWGVKDAYKLHPILTAREYITLRESDLALNGQTLSANEEAWKYIANETDWQKEGIRTATLQNYQFNVSGGTREVKYFLSANYTGDEGIMLHNTYDRFGVRARIDAELNKRVSVGININPTYSRRERPSTNFIDFYRTPSWLPVRHTEETAALTGREVGEYAHGGHFNNTEYTREDGTTFTASPWNTSNHNPRSLLDNDNRFQTDYRLQTSSYITIKLAKGLEFKTSNGFYYSYMNYEQYVNKGTKKEGDTNQSTYRNRLYVDLLTENTLNYHTVIRKKHDLSVLAGFTAEKSNTRTAGIVGTDFPTDYIHTINAATGLSLGDTYTLKEEEALLSVLGRVNYAYDDKYLVSASLRTDGSSKFGPDNRWGWFPSVSLGWRVSEEPFMKNIRWIDQLKLRGSWGLTGNNDIENYAHTDKLLSANYSFGPGTGTVTPGLANTSSVLGNKSIGWEQSSEYNFGADISVWGNRVNLSAEYYYSETVDMLFKQSSLAFSGYTEFWNNIGKVRNKGFEFELSTHNIRTQSFEWTTSFNLATNKNRLLDLGGDERQINYGERNEAYLAQVGKPAIQFYGFKTIGVWNSTEEIANNASHADDKPGGLRVMDVDKNGVIDDDDRVALGDPFPDFTWGMTNTFRYRNFDLTVMLQGVQGVDVLNGDGYYNETKKYNKNYVMTRWINAENPGDGKTPYQTTGMKWELTDYLIEDGSYWSVRDIVLGYTLPKKVSRKIGLNGLRVYTSAQNLYVHMAKGYRGVNPESRITSSQYASPLIDGYQRGGFPMQRTFTFGIDIHF
ncbi:MAG: TonB-dependent receptor [Bacteroides sp.]|nr:TonB-dependent receptor [Bacteroides sp.]